MWLFGRPPNLSFASKRVERWHTVSDNNAFTEASRGGLQGPIPDFRPGFSLGWKASTTAVVCSLPSARTMYGCSVVVCHLYGLFREQFEIVLAFVTTSFVPPLPPHPPNRWTHITIMSMISDAAVLRQCYCSTSPGYFFIYFIYCVVPFSLLQWEIVFTYCWPYEWNHISFFCVKVRCIIKSSSFSVPDCHAIVARDL